MNKKDHLFIPSDTVISQKQQLVNTVRERDLYKGLTYQLEQIFDHTIPLCMTDKNFNIVKANSAYAKMVDKTTEQCIGTKCYDNRPGKKCHTDECPVAMICTQKRGRVERECTKKRNNEKIYHILTSKPYYDKDGNIAGIIESFHDITERKKLEKRLHEHEKFLRTVIDTIQDEISVLTPDLDIIQTNKAVRDKYPEIALVGKKCYEVHFNSKKRCKKCPAVIALKSGQLEKGEFALTKRDGTDAVVEHFAFPMKDDEGKTIAIVEYVRDITVKKRSDEQQQKLINELNKALSEIKTLQGILPLCSYCKKIRDDKGYWEKVDVYIHKNTDADISHGICPDCLKEHFPKQYEEIKNDKTSKVKLL